MKVRSRAICSAAAKERAEPSSIGISIVHSHRRASNFEGKFGLRLLRVVIGNADDMARDFTPGPFGSSPLATTRLKV